MKVLIVDDEHIARAKLREMLKEIDSCINVIDAVSGEDAISQIESHHPNIVLLDISLSGISGVGLAYHLLAVDHAPAVIFTAAHNEYAIQAFDANAIDCLLKPIQTERLKIALAKAGPVTTRQNKLLEDGPAPRTHITVKDKDKLKLVKLSEIGFFMAEHKYVVVETKDSKYLLNTTLNKLEEELGDNFLRVHRKFLVSTFFLKGIEKIDVNKWQILLQDFDQKMIVSRRQKPTVRNWLINKK